MKKIITLYPKIKLSQEPRLFDYIRRLNENKDMSFLQKYHYHLWLHFTIIVWGFTGVLGKLIEADTYTIILARTSLAIIAIFIYLIILKKLKKIAWRQIIYFLATGFIISLHWFTFFESIKVSTVSIALTCMASTSFFVAIIDPIINKKSIQLYEILLGGLVVVGLLMVFSFELKYKLGITLAIISAFLAAVFTILNENFIKETDAAHITMYEMIGTFSAVFLFLTIKDKSIPAFPQLPLLDFIYLLILGVVCTAFAFLMGIYVMKELKAYTVAITVNLEPIYSIVLALFIFGETEYMSTGFYFGGLLILVTIFANAYIKRLTQKNQ